MNPLIYDLTSEPSWNGWSRAIQLAGFFNQQRSRVYPAAVGRLNQWALDCRRPNRSPDNPLLSMEGFLSPPMQATSILSMRRRDVSIGLSRPKAEFAAQLRLDQRSRGLKNMPHSSGIFAANIYSVDATTGKLLLKISHRPESRVSNYGRHAALRGSLVRSKWLHWRSLNSSSPNYRCCTFRGMVVALDSATGKQVWKTYTIPIPPTERTTPSGVTYWGPSAADVWGPLTIDPKREAVYFGTGNTFSAPDVGRSDAVMALNLDSGKLLWVKQVEAGDVWHTGCRGSVPPAGEGFPPRDAGQRPSSVVRRPNPNYKRPEMPASYYCPDPAGPDWDIAAGAMLVNLPDGKRLLVAGQKSGMAWGVGPDNDGALVWKSDISRGEIVFGGATDGEQAYYAFRSGGVAAIRVSDGLETWYTPITPQESMQNHYGFSAAVTAIPGVVFAAGLDGVLRAFDSFDGNQIWEYDTTPEVETVNGVKAHGGSIGSAGPTVSGGMVFVTSGYTGFQNGVPGNLLLAFGQR